ncbi:hypothetical protein PRNP1_010865 [Phytophthora ramorum]
MKSCIVFTATALIVAATINSATGLAIYLKELPNGDSFSQELGHPNKDSSQYTDFATAFAAAGHTWTTELCGATFPGASMTNGAAFGDPCCTWKKGDAPDNTVTAFTTTPGKATVCASTSDTKSPTSTEASATTEAPATEDPTTNAPTSTETPSATAPPSTDIPVTTDSPAYTDPPATTTVPASTDAPATATPSSGGCGVQSDNAAQSYRRFRH